MMEKNFNKHCGAKQLSQLKPGDNIRIRTDKESKWSEPAEVVSQAGPRSYIVRRGGTTYRRNRCHLKPTPTEQDGLQYQRSLRLVHGRGSTGPTNRAYWSAALPLSPHLPRRPASPPACATPTQSTTLPQSPQLPRPLASAATGATPTQPASSGSTEGASLPEEQQAHVSSSPHRRANTPEKHRPDWSKPSLSPRVTRSGRRFGL